MSSTPTYEEQWKVYRHRSRLFWLVFLGYVPGVFLLGVPLRYLFSSNIPVYIVAGLWMLAFAISGNYAVAWRCPRCGKPFFRGSWYTNSWARRCVHCQLPKWSCDPEAKE
ncbi:MAG: hypothetical protein ABJF10_17725 [Chthoniobacter sp.]|uniref:hypothetical protein n=1 Tax=Chthoniobacter sp. TaxID=2510640 RepID=UPI0032A6E278